MEIESPIRFIYTYLLIQLIVIGKVLVKNKKFIIDCVQKNK